MRLSLSLILLLSTSIPGLASGPADIQILGPFPRAPEIRNGPLAPKADFAPELNPAEVDPNKSIDLGLAQPLRWRSLAIDQEGCREIETAGIYWVLKNFETSRWTSLSIEKTGAESEKLWLDGEQTESAKKGVDLIRGRHQLLMRLNLMEDSRLCLSVSTDPETEIRWNPEGPRPLSSYQDISNARRFGPLALSSGGAYLARSLVLRNREGKTSTEVSIFAPEGSSPLPTLGPSSSAPESFAPQSNRLLLSRSSRKGTELRLVDLATGESSILCRNEPGLVFARFSPDGKQLLIASSAGLEKEKKDAKSPRHRKALREKLSDYQVRRQLFLIDAASGARRLLLPAGDHIIDDVRFLPSGKAILYLETYPLGERPWFETAIHRLDLRTGADEILGNFRGGWEGRPSRLAPSPDGFRVAIIGPPEEIGPGHREHNVYNRALWLLDLGTGELRRISAPSAPALSLGRSEFISWLDRGILAGVSIGSRTALGWFEEAENGGASCKFTEIPTDCEVLGNISLAPDGSALAFVARARTELPELRRLDLQSGAITTVERPNAEFAQSFRILPPRDESFRGPGGEEIDAWSYEAFEPEDPGHRPLILYYYGGAVPTDRSFDTEHQLLAANGYEVLVINPRGALGYGDAFADEHVNDWGPKASADILAGLDRFLARHPEVDAGHVGIYGGSYGGFMTEYLVSHSDRFAAAVSMYGISDIASYWGAGSWGYTYGDTALAGAYPWNRARLFSANSPLYNADQIHTPLLLLHGLADVNVPEGESEQLYTALESLGREVELVTFPGEDHGISGSWSNRVAHRRMMLEFFDRYLKNEPEAWKERWN